MIIDVHHALELLIKEQVVAIPTETVYGLAGRIDSEKALRQVFKTKERPFYDPLIIHIGHQSEASNLFETNPVIDHLIDQFWPGPLTIISKKKKHISSLITSGLESVGVRMPNHPLTLKLLNELKIPLAAPSANKFKKTSPTSAQHIETDFKGLIPILDGGSCEIGIESTVLEVHNNTEISIYREGKIDKESIQSFLFHKGFENISIKITSSNVSPGNMEDHYQPKVPFYILNKDPNKPNYHELVLSQDPLIAARELYHQLRVCSENTDAIFLIEDKYPKDGFWSSIWDRLKKASSKN